MENTIYRAKIENSPNWFYWNSLGEFCDIKGNVMAFITIEGITYESIFQIKDKIIKFSQGMFTGCFDKNLNPIFIGDIVRQQDFSKMSDISTYESKKEFLSHKRYLIKKCKCHFTDNLSYHCNYDYLVKWELNGFYPFADSPENCRHCGGAIDSENCFIIGNIVDQVWKVPAGELPFEGDLSQLEDLTI